MFNRKLTLIDRQHAFSTAGAYVRKYREDHPEKEILSLGIGDVSQPVITPVVKAMHEAVDDLSNMNSFAGYGNYYGIPSLRKAIAEEEYSRYGITADEIYVSDGTKSDAGNILELFDPNCKILTSNPAYPIYRNSALAMGRNIYETPLDENWCPVVPEEHYDIIYLCSPNNPTGVAYTQKELSKWVEYALKEKAIIIYDNVYVCFITEKDIPQSIYAIEGSKKCCIELRSLSKKASFTGLRCSYFVLPHEIDSFLFKERTINRFNGASYVAQKGALATYLPESKVLLAENMERYRKNTAFLRQSFIEMGFEVTGGLNAPYLWVKIKDDTDSFTYFHKILEETGVVIVPGSIFGSLGDHYFRISGLGTLENSQKAIARLREYHEKET